MFKLMKSLRDLSPSFFSKTTLMFSTNSNTSFPSRCLGALPFSSVPSNSLLILRYLWLGGKNRRLLMYTNFLEPKRYTYCVSPKHIRHHFFPFICPDKLNPQDNQ